MPPVLSMSSDQDQQRIGIKRRCKSLEKLLVLSVSQSMREISLVSLFLVLTQ